MIMTDTQTRTQTRYLVKAKTDRTKKWGPVVFTNTADEAIDQARTFWNKLVDVNDYVDVRIEKTK